MESGITTTILGKTSTGKTCYFMALYNLMKAGVSVNNIQLTLTMPIKKEKEDDDSLLRKQYKNLREKGIWPAPTPGGEIKEYNLFFCRDLRDKFPFTWVDYSGELLEEEGYRSGNPYNILTERIKQESTSVLFPLIGDAFAQPIPKDEWQLSSFKIEHGYSEFNHLMTEYIGARKEYGRPPVIVLLITKYDLCRERDFSEIVDEIQILFPAIFKGDCIVGIIPVSLGKELNGRFAVSPFQIHLPLVFILMQELEISLKIGDMLKKSAGDLIKDERNSLWRSFLEQINLNPRIDSAKLLQEKVETFRAFFLPYQKMLTDAVMKGKMVFFDDACHYIGV